MKVGRQDGEDDTSSQKQEKFTRPNVMQKNLTPSGHRPFQLLGQTYMVTNGAMEFTSPINTTKLVSPTGRTAQHAAVSLATSARPAATDSGKRLHGGAYCLGAHISAEAARSSSVPRLRAFWNGAAQLMAAGGDRHGEAYRGRG